MALVVLIEDPQKLTDVAEADMRRWWGQTALKKAGFDGEVYFVVAGKFKLYEGAKRFRSFGVPARVARRPAFPWCAGRRRVG